MPPVVDYWRRAILCGRANRARSGVRQPAPARGERGRTYGRLGGV